MTKKKHLDLRVTNITTTNIPDEHGYETYKKKVTGLTNLKRHFVNSDMMWLGLEHHLASVSEWGSAPNHGIPQFFRQTNFWGPPNSPPKTHWPVIIFHSNTAPWWGLSCSWVPNLYSKSKFEQKFPIAMLIYVGLAKGTPKTELNRCCSSPNNRETPHIQISMAHLPEVQRKFARTPPNREGVGSKKSKVSFADFHQFSLKNPSNNPKLHQRSPNSQACVPFFRPKRMPPHGIRPGWTHSQEKHMMYMVSHSKSLYKSI